jgi:CRP/FNR family transcriptional regulator
MKTSKHIHCAKCLHRQQSIFCHSQTEVPDEIHEYKTCMYFKRGETIFHEGGHGFGIYCISSGKVKLSISGEDGKEQIVRLARAGDVLGYRAVLSGERYGASTFALEDTSVCFIPKATFFGCLKQDTNLSFETMKQLSNQLHKAEQRITLLAQRPVRERLAEALLFMLGTYGYESNGHNIAVQLSREDIANIVGTATETAIRILSKFNRDGIIGLHGKKISIINEPGLYKVANFAG